MAGDTRMMIEDGDSPLPALGENKANLDRTEMFADKIDVFRAGTFKFQKNLHFCEDVYQFEKQMTDEFYQEHKN
jgi:hypothetical protein